MNISLRHDPFPVAEPYQGIYSHGVEVPSELRTLYVSGQIGISPEGHLQSGFRGQCKQAILNVEKVLHDANMKLTNIVKMSIFMIRREDMEELFEIRKEMLDGIRPAVTNILVAGLVSPDWLVEIDVIASAK